MSKVWGVHMPEWVPEDPIDKGFVCTGWARTGA
jgi:restriction system protein